MNQSEPMEETPKDRFLKQFWKDREAGRVLRLEEYLALFPGDPAGIAAEFEAVAALPKSSDDHSPPSKASQSFSGIHPEMFPGYCILREIGRGGQATVYLAKDLKVPRQVALKVLRSAGFAAENELKRFKHEAEVAARLDNHGICKIYAAGVENGVAYIAMQYVEGETLHAYIHRLKLNSLPTQREIVPIGAPTQKLDDLPASVQSAGTSSSQVTVARAQEIVKIVEQVARILHVAHEAGIIHRDIKPGNIMIRHDGTPLILDFGLARDLESEESLTTSGDFFGTPPYMSPEQLAGNKILIDRRTDLWSLGVMTYEALTLKRPFDTVSRSALYQAIISKEPTPVGRLNPGIPRDLSVVVATAMEKDRDRRYQTAEALAEDLRRVIASEPILARPAGPWTRAMKWARRNRALATSLSALFIVLVVAVVLLSSQLRKESRLVGELRRSSADRQAQIEIIDELRQLARDRRLLSQVEHLWPPRPAQIPTIHAWLENVKKFHALVPKYKKRVADKLGVPLDAVVLDQIPATEDGEAERIADCLREGLKAVEFIPHVERLLKYAENFEEDAVIAQKSIWDRTLAELKRDPKFGRLLTEPVPGLIPLGKDRDSGLQEFAVYGSGTVPARDEQTGKLILSELTGVIVVFVPGGMTKLLRVDDEGSWDFSLDLDPFFISKFETTQAQWLHVMGGKNPARSTPEKPLCGGELVTLRNPVDSVSHGLALNFGARLGGLLPTESRWEHACRATTETAFWFGSDIASICANENILDETGMAKKVQSNSSKFAPCQDHYGGHAPVGTFKANLWGLFDMGGNVSEWCLDVFVRDPDFPSAVRRERDGCVEPGDPNVESRSVRGASWAAVPKNAPVYYRQPLQRTKDRIDVGFRIVIPIPVAK